MMNAGLTDQTRKRKRGWVYSLRILFQIMIRFPVKSQQTFELKPRQYLHKHPMRNVRNANSCDTPRVPMQCLFFTHTHTHTHTSPIAESCMYPVRRLSYTNPRSSNSTQIKGKLQCAMLKSHKNVTDYLAFETYLMRMRDIWGRGRPKSFLLPSKGGVKFTPGFAFTWR